MREPEDMEEQDAWRDEEPPPRACPECGDDDRHAPDCSRNYRLARKPTADYNGEDNYWLGYRHGKRTAEHGPSIDHEHRLKLELALMGKRNRAHRAFALGELRGYRQATDRYLQVVDGHRLLG